MAREISNPRPFYNEIEPSKKTRFERLEAGGGSGGIVLDITRQGLVVNGYYAGFSSSDVRYANTLNPVTISWEDLQKAKERVDMPAKKVRKRAGIRPDKIEEHVDKDYLKTLPIVTINKTKYYIDGERRERRAVHTPEKVFKF